MAWRARDRAGAARTGGAMLPAWMESCPGYAGSYPPLQPFIIAPSMSARAVDMPSEWWQ